jgi:hypothetical protein
MTVTSPHQYITTKEAAARLCVSERALRERIRRNLRKEGRHLVADLDVIIFTKFGRSWRGRWVQ